MSILTEALPDHLVIAGKKCKINTDFKAWLRFSNVISAGVVSAKQIASLFKCIFEELPPDMPEALREIVNFYTHEREQPEDEEENGAAKRQRCVDFEYDADLIYSAFMQQYGIDLCSAEMHWWKFKALLNGLSEDTHFVKVVQFRSMDISKINDRELKRFYMQMKAQYRLPDDRTTGQKENRLNAALTGMF